MENNNRPFLNKIYPSRIVLVIVLILNATTFFIIPSKQTNKQQQLGISIKIIFINLGRKYLFTNFARENSAPEGQFMITYTTERASCFHSKDCTKIWLIIAVTVIPNFSSSGIWSFISSFESVQKFMKRVGRVRHVKTLAQGRDKANQTKWGI